MELDFWRERWDSGRIGWNQSNVHPVLSAEWHRQIERDDGSVFVPLCGKSVDMDWLASRGYHVVGNELSEVAVAEFFAERGLVPSVRDEGNLTVHSAEGFELWCGDFFELPANALEGVVAVYDRASMIALPPEMRGRYVEHLTTIAPADAPIFLLAIEYDESEMSGPPFCVTRDEISTRFSDTHGVEVVSVVDAFARNPDLANRGLTHLLETLTLLRRRT